MRTADSMNDTGVVTVGGVKPVKSTLVTKALVALCITFSFWFFLPVFFSLYSSWIEKDSYYSHGILVPVISGLLVWALRDRLASIPIKPSLVGFAVVVPSIFLVILFNLANGSGMQSLVLPVFIYGFVITIFGAEIAKALWFPIGYIYFMCPLPGFMLNSISFRIQVWSTIGATEMLRVLGLDASRQGVNISLPNVEVMVGAPCSGFRLLISLIAFSVLFVYLIEGPLSGKILLLALTLPLSVVLNSIRILMIAIVGEYMGTETMHAFHDYSGYIMLLLAFVVFYFLSRLFGCRKFNSTLLP